jgi:surface polysaccharide O-acyltransferase-like enzyme
MISGSNLIDYRKKYDTKTFFIKRFKKVVIPFIFFSLFAIIYFAFILKTFNIKNETMLSLLDITLNSKLMKIYWFFPSLICVYLCFPLFSAIKEDLKMSIIKYIIIIGLIFNNLIPFLISVFKINISIPIYIYVCGGYLLYALIGYYINNTNLSKKGRIIIYILGFIGLFMHFYGTYYLSYKYNELITIFKDYNNIPCILYSTSIFVFVKYLFQNTNISNNKFMSKSVLFLKDYTFSIYLIHIFVIYGIDTIFKFSVTSILYRLLIPIPTIFICILITYLIRKIKILRVILP